MAHYSEAVAQPLVLLLGSVHSAVGSTASHAVRRVAQRSEHARAVLLDAGVLPLLLALLEGGGEGGRPAAVAAAEALRQLAASSSRRHLVCTPHAMACLLRAVLRLRNEPDLGVACLWVLHSACEAIDDAATLLARLDAPGWLGLA